jgi:Domain of unknown function (DUF4190)
MSTTESNGPTSPGPVALCGNGHQMPQGSSFCPQCGAPGATTPAAADPFGAPPVPSPPGAPIPPPPGYQMPPTALPPTGYQQPVPTTTYVPPGPFQQGMPYGYAAAPVQPTNALAVTSLVLGILWVLWLGSVLAIILGFIALKQIPQRNQSGKGLAIAGIVLGFVGAGTLTLVILGAIFASDHTNNGSVILPALGLFH